MKHNNCELGYVFWSKFWGKGYATETLKIVIEYLIKECNFHLVEAKHHASNPASGRVMEKAGMKKDGILRERRKNKLIDGYDDLVIYSITKKEVLFKKWLLFSLLLRPCQRKNFMLYYFLNKKILTYQFVYFKEWFYLSILTKKEK